MAMTVKKRSDTKLNRVFMHKIADVRGGVSVSSSELGSAFLLEGTPISKPVNGICHAIKVARLTADVQESETDIKVAKNHNLKVGDYVMSAEGTAVKITEINDSAKTLDTIKIGSALGTLKKGATIVEATEEGALKYEPFALVGTSIKNEINSNIIVDAWLIGVTAGNTLPDFVANKLTGIINY